jgi:hypothetical protein
MAKELSNITIHRDPGHRGPTIAPEQGGTQYAQPKVVEGTLRSSAPGRGRGDGQTFVHRAGGGRGRR